jgi:hypothetical protein
VELVLQGFEKDVGDEILCGVGNAGHVPFLSKFCLFPFQKI